ncbi:HYR domain-containing protein [Hymenobacter sp. 102]|uniref:HYR domain-containing protein n=1 Tax=Hymenobacter sp. 102 TaxID=3403152 RepID=UPI003CF7E503
MQHNLYSLAGQTTSRWGSQALRLLLLTCALVLSVATAQATHFRYGSLTWRTAQSDPTGRTIVFKVSQAWRSSAYGNPTVGASIPTDALIFGDGQSAGITLQVTSVDPLADNFYGEATITHTYPAATAYTAYYSSCCRISSLFNNRDASWYVSTRVQAGSGNNSPVSTMPPVVNLATGQTAATFQLAATDPDGQSLQYSLATSADLGGVGFTNAPGLAVNPTTGVVTFNTVGAPLNRLYNAAIKVSDGQTSVIVDFIINITRVSAPPVFDYSLTPSNGYVYQLSPGQTLTFGVRATDSDAGDQVRLQAIGLPPGAGMSPGLPATGNPVQSTFTWTPTISNLGSSVISFVAQDQAGVQTTSSVTIVVSTRPVFDVPPTAASGSVLHVTPGTVINQTIQASNAGTGSLVRITGATGLPAAATFSPALPTLAANPTSTQLSWTPAVADWGLHTATFTATNNYNDQATHQLQFIVNSAPSFVSTPTSLNVVAGQPFVYNVVLADADLPYGDELEIEHPTLPAWLTLTDNGDGTGTLSGTPAVADAGLNPVTLVAADIYHHGMSYGLITQSFDINVIPCTVQALAQDVTVQLDANGQAQVLASQVDAGSTASCGVASISVAPASFDCSARGTNQVTLTVTDSNGYTATATATVTVVDGIAPSLTAPAAVTVSADAGQCSASNVALGAPTATDNCSGVTVTNNAPAIFGQGTTTVTWTATDAAGTTTTATQLVTVNDTEKPALTVPANLTVTAPASTCGAVVSFQPTATDNCGTVSISTSVASGSLFAVGTTPVTVTATDAAGNTSTGSFTVTVLDVTAPTVATRNVTVTLVNGAAQITAADVNNGSTDACGLAGLTLSRQQFSCANLGANPVTLTATDVHGNVASAPAVVTVVGSIPAPVITVTPGTNVYTGGVATTLYLGYGPQTATLTATGGVQYAWSPAAGLSSSSVANPTFTARTPGTYTYIVTVINQYGCSATATVTLTVVDVRCGNKNEKVVVCHNGHEICISPNAVPTHLTQHPDDRLGTCSAAAQEARPAAAAETAAAAVTASDRLVFDAYPNPFSASTTVHIRPTSATAAKVRVYDSMGRVVAVLFDGMTEAGRDYELTLDARTLATGLYLCRYEAQGQVITQRLAVSK